MRHSRAEPEAGRGAAILVLAVVLGLAASVGGGAITASLLWPRVEAKMEAMAPEPPKDPTPAFESSLTLVQGRLDVLREERNGFEERVRELERLLDDVKVERDGALARADEFEREAMGLREVLLEEELRYRAILQGLRRFDLASREEVEGTLIEAGTRVETPAGSVVNEGSPPGAGAGSDGDAPPIDVPILDGEEAHQILDDLLAAEGLSRRLRVREIRAVIAGRALDLVLEEIEGEDGHVVRAFSAESTRFVLEEPDGVTLLLERGSLLERGLEVPFFDGRYRLPLHGADLAMWREKGAALVEESRP
jgi:hypothetical protein